MEQQQGQMYANSQYQQHMSAYRPGIRPGMVRPGQPGFMQNRILDPRFPHMQNSMGDSDPIHPGMNPHLAGMGMGMGISHMGPGMVRHPGMIGSMGPGMSTANIPISPYSSAPMNALANMNQKPMAASMGAPSGPIINSPVMSPISGHGGMIPRSMSPQGMGVPDRQLVGPPSMSPQSMGGGDRPGMFQPGQYRLSSPQYSPAHPGPNPPNFSPSSPYPGSQTYPPSNPAHIYKPPTPQSYPKPPTPQAYKPPTPQSYPKPPTPQNPATPNSYPNPSTPGSYPNPTTPVSYPNPTTPVSNQNPSTPQPPSSYDPPTPQNSAHNTSFDSSNAQQPVIQQNLHVSTAPVNTSSGSSGGFVLPKTESVIQSPVHNVFKDSSKITTPMLSPPSTTSSLRKIRRPSKTVSPNQKTLSPNQMHANIKSEPEQSLLVPKLEPTAINSPPPPTVKSEPVPPATTPVKEEPVLSPKVEVKEEPVEESRAPTPPPPRIKTPPPPIEPRWGEGGADGMPEKALEIIFSYVCHVSGSLPALPYAMRVCKLWNKVASKPTLWTHANLGSAVKEKSRTEKKLEWILKNKFPHAVQVDVTSWKAVMSAPALRIIAANCPKLTGLGLSNCVKLNYEDVRIIPSLFPNLERIDLSLVSVS